MTDITGSEAANPLDPELHIPGLPSDDEIAASILKGIPDDALHMRTNGTVTAERARSDTKHKAFNLAHRQRPDYMPAPDPAKLEEKVREAKLLVGPGPDATPYENELFQQRVEEQQLLRDIGRLDDKLKEVVRWDAEKGPDGGIVSGSFTPIYAYSDDRRAAMQYELEDLQDKLVGLHGDVGLRRREVALAASVEAVKQAHRRQFIHAQGARLADKKALEQEIEERSEQVLATRGLKLGADAQR